MDSKLLDLGFAFKKSQIWKVVYEEELFAIHLPKHLILADGSEYVYCSVMGRGGEHRALSVYMGQRGLNSLRIIQQDPNTSDMEKLLSQDCLQCSLEQAEQFLPEDLQIIKEETKKRKMRSPYPQFSRYKPYCVPWHLTDPKDIEILTIALEVTMVLSAYLQNHSKSDIHLHNMDIQSSQDVLCEQLSMEFMVQPIDEIEKNQKIPVFAVRKGQLITEEMIDLPEQTNPVLLMPTVVDELKLRTLKTIPKEGVLECQILRIPEPTKEKSEDSAPYLPAILLSVDEDGMVRLPLLMRHAEYDPDEAVNDLLRRMIEERFRPNEIRVRTDETYVLLELFCKKAGIRLTQTDQMDFLDEAMDAMLDRWTERTDEEEDSFGIEELIEMLEEIPENELRAMPDFMIAQIIEAAEEGLLPDTVADKVRRIAKGRRK